jgi:O-acetyl-ADP-ribose deacetylase (regulator of RNase III)
MGSDLHMMPPPPPPRNFTERRGDLFSSKAAAIGHGVNTKGLMGAGIAAAFRAAYPDMYKEYRLLCTEGLLNPGDIFPYKTRTHTVINIASQEHPGPDAKIEWLQQGVGRALEHCRKRGLDSLALPRIGCGIGGLNWSEVRTVLQALSSVYPSIGLEVWSL